jgi:hypothetical protein
VPPDRQYVSAVLRAGEASLHDLRITHGSLANRTDQHRCGLVARYISTEWAPRFRRVAATLVRGADRFARFDLEPSPRFDRDPLAAPWRARCMRGRRRDIFWTTLITPRARFSVAMRMLTQPDNLRFFLRSAGRFAIRALTRRRHEPPPLR